MDEFTENTAFLLVLEFLETFKNRKEIIVNESDSYIGENDETYIKMLKIPIETFLTECEKREILQKITVTNKTMTHKILDVEKLQKSIRGLTLNNERITFMENESVMKNQQKMGKHTKKEKAVKKLDSRKQASEGYDKGISGKNKKSSKANQLGSTAINIKESFDDEIAARRYIEEKYALHPFISRIVMKTLTDLHKRNSISRDEICSYVDKYNEARMEILMKNTEGLMGEEKLASMKNERVKKKYRRNRRHKQTLIKMGMSEKNEDREKEVSKLEDEANSSKNMINFSQINQLDSTTLAEKDFGNGVFVAHKIISNFSQNQIATQNAMKVSSPSNAIVSKPIIEPQNVLAEFNGACMYGISSYSVAEFKDGEKPVKRRQALNSIEKCTEFMGNTFVQEGQCKKRRTESEDDIKKKNENSEKCIPKQWLRRKQLRLHQTWLNVLKFPSFSETFNNNIKKKWQKTVEIRSLLTGKNYQIDMKVPKSLTQKVLNDDIKHDVIETDLEEKFKIKKAERNEKCKHGLKRKSDLEENMLMMKKKRIN